jgi:hypothetical protein
MNDENVEQSTRSQLTTVLDESTGIDMANIRPDQLEALRVKYREQISASEAETKRLKEKLSLVDEISTDVKRLPTGQATSGSSNQYSGWSLTKAIVDAVPRIARNGPVTGTEVMDYIKTNGYQHEGKWFYSSAILTLKRLAKAGTIITEKDGDRRVYKAKI